MKMKYEKKPSYPEVEVIAKTVDSVTGTIDRRKVGRRLLTEEVGFDVASEERRIVGGDETAIKTVAKIETSVEVAVELVGGIKSLATYKFFTGWTAKNDENDDVLDVYVPEGASENISKAVATASRMCSAHPECDGQWKLVDAATGKRVFLRLVATDLGETGMVK